MIAYMLCDILDYFCLPEVAKYEDGNDERH